MCAQKVFDDKEIITDKQRKKGQPCYKCLVCNWTSRTSPWLQKAENALLSHLETCGKNEAACAACWEQAKVNGETITGCIHVDPTAQVHPLPRMRRARPRRWIRLQ